MEAGRSAHLDDAPHPPPVLQVRGLEKRFANGTVALAGVDLEVFPGEVVGILGPSGAGKSSLLRCLNRLVEPTAGTVQLRETRLSELSGWALARARKDVGFVFQQFNLIASYSALDNVLAGRIAHHPLWRNLLRRYPPRDVALARAALASVGLEEKAHVPARELSGGQQQRVAIARVFAQEPSVVLADEPTASLDPALAKSVLELLVRPARERGACVLVNLHQLELARSYCSRVVGMRNGRKVFDGPPADFSPEAVESLYRTEGNA